MNERIKLLALQAQKVVGHTDGGYTEIKVLDQEKFAELIIEECANLCEQRYVEHKDLSDESVEAMMCCNAIREHFGVEE